MLLDLLVSTNNFGLADMTRGRRMTAFETLGRVEDRHHCRVDYHIVGALTIPHVRVEVVRIGPTSGHTEGSDQGTLYIDYRIVGDSRRNLRNEPGRIGSERETAIRI
jgi:hypothetical protein